MSNKRECSVDGCTSVVLARGWCSQHYGLWHRNKGTDVPLLSNRIPEGSKCAIEGCGNLVYCKGWCRAHHSRWRRYGDANAPHIKVHRIPKGTICSVKECAKPANSRSLCKTHHVALLRKELLERMMGRPKSETCEICNTAATGKGRSGNSICFDHDHKTGKPRGWICSGCNKAIGLVKEDIGRLNAIISYLERHKNGEAEEK